MLHIVTAGIERNIILHSPTPSSPCTQNLARTPVETRVLSDDGELDQFMYHRALRGAPVHGDMHDPDSLNINMFDQ
jgi:WD repeat-containing protein 22